MRMELPEHLVRHIEECESCQKLLEEGDPDGSKLAAILEEARIDPHAE
jgi:hypothetical protein